MADVVQLLGACLIVVPFAWSQMGNLSPESKTYLLLNFAGSGLLATVAALDEQWGFLLLEGTWALVSILALLSQRNRV